MSLMGAAFRECSFSRPRRTVVTRPAAWSTARCLLTDCRAMSSPAHSWRSVWPLWAFRLSSSMRRLGSASALNTSSISLSPKAAIWLPLNLGSRTAACQGVRGTRRTPPTAPPGQRVRLLHLQAACLVRRAVAVPARGAIQSARAPTEALAPIPAWGPACSQSDHRAPRPGPRGLLSDTHSRRSRDRNRGHRCRYRLRARTDRTAGCGYRPAGRCRFGLYQLVLKHRPLSLLDLRGRGRFLGIQVQLGELARISGQPS